MLTQASRLSIVFIMLLGFAQIEAQEIPNGIMPNYRRQVAGTGNSNSKTTTTTPNPPNSSPPPEKSTTKKPTTNVNKQTSTTAERDTSTAERDTTTTSKAGSTVVKESTTIPTTVKITTTNAKGEKVTSEVSTHTIAKTTETRKNSIIIGAKTTINAATLTKPTVIKTPLVTSKTEKETFTSFYTSGGSVYSTVITTNTVVPVTTGFAKTTVSPSLAQGGGSGSGLSGSSKAVIGGVVGGIGGAALIGGIAFVLWRLWGKKKQEDRYSDYTDKYSSNRDSRMTFGSEGYGSSYGGRVNTASNF